MRQDFKLLASVSRGEFWWWYPTSGMKMSGFIGNIRQRGKWVRL